MRNSVWIDVFGLGAVFGWVAVSIAFAINLNGDMFQRMGAAGVAVAVAYFAFVKHSQSNPAGLHERLFWISKTLDYHGRCLRVSFSNSSVIASIWKQKCDERGEAVPQPIAELAKGLELAFGAAEQEIKFSEEDADKRFRDVMDRSNSVDELVSSVKYRSEIIQMVVISLATIQWGFGDLWFRTVCEVPC